ncbi:Protein phosphatase 1 regulatory subunit 3D [Toxocara canis]|uniref:Protein phosphatase 1 regulatory subunit 3D n=1 Tax=Toxocara canis TaxID=6265 RepID=A0A0B2UXD6_TOXCA|nr:Protein phosphatase 1 regulatory subunit 3D [Toxocara canis]
MHALFTHTHKPDATVHVLIVARQPASVLVHTDVFTIAVRTAPFLISLPAPLRYSVTAVKPAVRTSDWTQAHTIRLDSEADREAVRKSRTLNQMIGTMAPDVQTTVCRSQNVSAAILIPPCAASPPIHSSEMLSQSPLNIYSSYSTSSTKLRNPLGLKLLIAATKTDEGFEEQKKEGKFEWNSDHLDSSSPCSPSSRSTASRDSTCDSGFSSDDNSLTRTPAKKLARTKSLRSALRTPTSSGPQKTVRFADALGLDLEQKTVYDADDWRDEEFGASLSLFSYPVAPLNLRRTTAIRLTTTNWSIRSEAEVSHLTRTQCVCLKSVDVIDTNVTGVVDVLNLAPEKQVCVRYTVDSWATFSEARAMYMESVGNDGAVDAFTFFIAFPNDLPVGAVCQFCIRYTVNGTSYWDSNSGANYSLEYVESHSNDYDKKESADQKKESNNPLWGFLNSKPQKNRGGFGAHKFDYLPDPPNNTRSSRNSGWGHCGYSYDNEVGFY